MNLNLALHNIRGTLSRSGPHRHLEFEKVRTEEFRQTIIITTPFSRIGKTYREFEMMMMVVDKIVMMLLFLAEMAGSAPSRDRRVAHGGE